MFMIVVENDNHMWYRVSNAFFFEREHRPDGNRSATDAWETAKAEFLRTLSPQDKILYQDVGPNDVEKLVREFERESSSKRTFRLMRKLDPLCETLKIYKGIASTCVQISPLMLGPIWASLLLLLRVMAIPSSELSIVKTLRPVTGC